MYRQLPGTIARGLFMIILIILPSAILPASTGDAQVVIMLVALFAAIFTIAEYSSESPSLIEFRDAAPYNRIRFISLFVAVFMMSVFLTHDPAQAPSTFVLLLHALGDRIGLLLDFPYSPVRLMQVMMPDDTSEDVLNAMRGVAGLSYFISLISLVFFIYALWKGVWPRPAKAFNVWINLPTFDPTAGGDVVERLHRDSTINLLLGVLLPFIIPAVLKVAWAIMAPIGFDDPQTLIWIVALWAFLPASLLMRGVALGRVANMIHAQRQKAYAEAAAEGMLPV